MVVKQTRNHLQLKKLKENPNANKLSNVLIKKNTSSQKFDRRT